MGTVESRDVKLSNSPPTWEFQKSQPVNV